MGSGGKDKVLLPFTLLEDDSGQLLCVGGLKGELLAEQTRPSISVSISMSLRPLYTFWDDLCPSFGSESQRIRFLLDLSMLPVRVAVSGPVLKRRPIRTTMLFSLFLTEL